MTWCTMLSSCAVIMIKFSLKSAAAISSMTSNVDGEEQETWEDDGDARRMPQLAAPNSHVEYLL